MSTLPDGSVVVVGIYDRTNPGNRPTGGITFQGGGNPDITLPPSSWAGFAVRYDAQGNLSASPLRSQWPRHGVGPQARSRH